MNEELREEIAKLLAKIKRDDWEWESTKQKCRLEAIQILTLFDKPRRV